MEFDVVNGRVIERSARPHAEFYLHAVLDIDASKQEGRRIYHDATYIKIKAQGAKDFVSRKATEEDKRIYAKEYAAFINDSEPEGMDVGLLIQSLGDLAEAKSLGITTVEKLAEIEVLPENLKPYRNKAKIFMELNNETDREGQESASSDRGRQVHNS